MLLQVDLKRSEPISDIMNALRTSSLRTTQTTAAIGVYFSASFEEVFIAQAIGRLVLHPFATRFEQSLVFGQKALEIEN